MQFLIKPVNSQGTHARTHTRTVLMSLKEAACSVWNLQSAAQEVAQKSVEREKFAHFSFG